ncbi:MAG: DUF1648 domain-containing protein [Chloroflexi bacterium]|nr:DUF1648 domain-containing protein [Chloroflexota bacterium]
MYRIIWVVSIMAIVAVIFVGYLYQASLPPFMPSHWNSAGEVDGWQSSDIYVWAMPIITLIIVCVLGIISHFQHDITIKSSIAYSTELLTVYMLSMHILIGMRVVQGSEVHVADILRLMAGLFIGLAFVIRDVPQNHVVGFRLPWTMADATVWRATHRVGFWGMFVGGLVVVVVTLFPFSQEGMFLLGMCAVLVGVVIPSFYAYWLAKRKSTR